MPEFGHRSLNPARLPVPPRTRDTTKCARQELNLHARIGHPGLSRARLPEFRHERGCHHCVVFKVPTRQRYPMSNTRAPRPSGCVAGNDGAPGSGRCKADISAKAVEKQGN